MTEKLIEGFRAFRQDTYGDDGALMPRLTEEGQNPEYLIISCIDSRGHPSTIFRAPPGMFFAHKAMGAIVRPYKKGTALSAALQFALLHNNVRKIIILGHTGCSAVKALVDKIDDEEIASFIDVAQAALSKAKIRCGPNPSYNDLLRKTEKQIILQSVENLKTYPSVEKVLTDGALKIVPWLFDMEAGNLLAFNFIKDDFEPITHYADEHKNHTCAHC